jgi:hypothetical protein
VKKELCDDCSKPIERTSAKFGWGWKHKKFNGKHFAIPSVGGIGFEINDPPPWGKPEDE